MGEEERESPLLLGIPGAGRLPGPGRLQDRGLQDRRAGRLTGPAPLRARARARVRIWRAVERGRAGARGGAGGAGDAPRRLRQSDDDLPRAGRNREGRPEPRGQGPESLASPPPPGPEAGRLGAARPGRRLGPDRGARWLAATRIVPGGARARAGRPTHES